MTGWDGRGLPPAAAARLERFHAGGLRTSLLSVADAASLEGVGLPFVGEVMGCMVQRITWTGTGVPNGLPSTTTFVAGPSGHHYVQALYTGYRTAISRMVADSTSMGAVGIVGATVTRSDVGNACTETFGVMAALRIAAACGLRPRTA